MANTGKPMNLTGFSDPVVIDMKGAYYNKDRSPIIADHDTALRIGHTTNQIILQDGEAGTINGKRVRGPLIAAEGVRSSKSGVARAIVSDLKNGFPFQVSVGAQIMKGYLVESGEKVEVNGRTWKGPLIVSSKTKLEELTVTVLGADSDTLTQIAAKSLRKESPVTFQEYLASLHLKASSLSPKQRSALLAQHRKMVLEAKNKKATKTKVRAKTRTEPEPEPEPLRKKVKAKEKVLAGGGADDDLKDYRTKRTLEAKRIDGIEDTFKEFTGKIKGVRYNGKKLKLETFKAKAIESGMDEKEFELVIRRSDYPVQTGPSIHSKTRDVEGKALECSILRRSMVIPNSDTNIKSKRKFGIETMYTEEVLEASEGKQYVVDGIADLFDLQIRAAGYTPTSRNKDDLFRQMHDVYHTKIKAASFSTLNVVQVLENVMNKSALAGFEFSQGIWSRLCAKRSMNDFKPHYLYRMDWNGSYKKVAADGELKHVSMFDTKKSITADTYGAMISIDRKTRINDDLGMIVTHARGLGVLGGQRIEESVFVMLLSNPGSFFATGNGNLLTGSGSPLSLAALTTARQAWRNQVINGKPINNGPTMLLTGTTLETLAGKIYKQQKLAATGDTDDRIFVDNEFAGLYEPLVSGYLDNTAILDQDGNAITGQSATQWYLLTPPGLPQGSAMVIGFLNGKETPYFDEAETQFNTPDGIQFRSYLDWGTAMHIEQLAYKSAGA